MVLASASLAQTPPPQAPATVEAVTSLQWVIRGRMTNEIYSAFGKVEQRFSGPFEVRIQGKRWRIDLELPGVWPATSVYCDGTNGQELFSDLVERNRHATGILWNGTEPIYASPYVRCVWLAYGSGDYIRETNWMHVPWFGPQMRSAKSKRFEVVSVLNPLGMPEEMTFRTVSELWRQEVKHRAQHQIRPERERVPELPDGLVNARYKVLETVDAVGMRFPRHAELIRYGTRGEPGGERDRVQGYKFYTESVEALTAGADLELPVAAVAKTTTSKLISVADHRFETWNRPGVFLNYHIKTNWPPVTDPELVKLAAITNGRFDRAFVASRRNISLRRAGALALLGVVTLWPLPFLWKQWNLRNPKPTPHL